MRAFLNEHHYVWRDFAVASNGASSTGPGAAGIIGVDPSSGDKIGDRAAAAEALSSREESKASEEAPGGEAGGSKTDEEQGGDASATAVKNS